MANKLIGISKLNFLLFIIQIILKINYIKCACANGNAITDTNCFNNLIIIPYYYRGGQFVTYKDGTMIIEYANDNSEGVNPEDRLFYGLKKNGRNYFQDDNAQKIVKIETSLTEKGRYEARNILVYLEDDTERGKQYLFSTSAYDTLTELHDIEAGTYKVASTRPFWEVGVLDIFSYQYSFMEIQENNQNIYFLAFTQHESDQIEERNTDGSINKKDYSKTITIKKFGIKSFDLNDYHKIGTKNIYDNFNNRIVSAFIMEQSNIIVLFYLKSFDANFKDFKNAKYAIKFYDYNLNEKNEIVLSENYVSDPKIGEGMFFKGLYIKENYAAFLYYTKGTEETFIQFNVTTLVLNNGEYSFNTKIEENKGYYFLPDITTNEFIKINDDRLAFIANQEYKVDSATKYKFFIILYDLYNTYSNAKRRLFYYELDKYRFMKELTAYVYNGFLVFTSTAIIPDESNSNYLSILTFFGYPNGTDFEVDIFPYLMDTGSITHSNIFSDLLMPRMKIENNIFGYEKVEKINLVSIPDELLFYNITGGVQDENPLPNNTFFDANHKLYQNRLINKTDRYYYLDYQYIVKETTYNNFYSTETVDIPNNEPGYDGSTYYEQNRKTFYGRTNRLKFKLCYNFCGTCIELRADIDNQKCYDCLEDYTYDYWAYLGKYIGNCVEENKYYDFGGTNKIINCDSSFKYFIDNKNNKRICFKPDQECPYDYSTYDSGSKQCIYTPRTTLIVEPTTVPIITTQLDSPTTNPIITTEINAPTTIPIITTEVGTPTIIPFISTQVFNPTTSPNIEPSTISDENKNLSICNYDSYYNKECNFSSDYSYSQVLDKMREILPTYSKRRSSLSIASNGYAFEISNDERELAFINDDDSYLPKIDLSKCGDKLKSLLRNNNTDPLILLKYGKISNKTYEKEVQFEVYDPDTFEKINLSICTNSDINLYINMPLSDDLVKIIQNIIDQGYDPLDIRDKFYREICTPYDSENGTDVLLDAREEYYYSSLNDIVCPDHCHTSNYDLESKYLKCECPVNESDITLNLKHITGENIANSFYSTLKNSNWKVMICYNLVFSWKMFKRNIGSILSLILFLVYVGFMVYYAFRTITPLQLIISKIMFKERDDKNSNDMINDNISIAKMSNKSKNKNKNKKVKIKYPPKKDKSRKNNLITNVKNSESFKTVTFNESKKLKGERIMTNPDKPKKVNFKDKPIKELIYTEGANLNKKQETIMTDKEMMLNLDNFELNNLEYCDAIKYDKRPFLKVYWSVLLREHVVLFTFVAWKDYNLFYIKIERFLVLMCTQLAMNGLFFSDESMHKANNTDDYNFVQQLPKIIFSLIATHIIEVILCYFSMTDKTIYKIKELSKDKKNDEKIIDEISCVKRKIVGFFVFTFLLFLFYWYFISAFCAVYRNTQKTFLLDSLIGIVVQFIDPFFIYCFTCGLRHISLSKCANNNMECLYKTSDLIPIF